MKARDPKAKRRQAWHAIAQSFDVWRERARREAGKRPCPRCGEPVRPGREDAHTCPS